jgi:hypothetical protein
VRSRSAGLTSVIVVALVAAVLIGSQVFAGAGSTTLRVRQPAPAATSTDADADDGDDGDCANDACGNAHSEAVHAWVKCQALHGKDACVKPAPPGKTLRQAIRSGTAPGPASTNGHGHGWGRAYAPGQLKNKDKPTSEDDPDDDDPDD